ncbi:ABC transporter ATP-binding protein [Oenococcus kitaharae]|uniref:Multiple sugar ABC transporter n=1 Tax=Oenococcus kitaharae DSM 17330 TaxID=1045004 RepID=G9WHK4_9LACO|nr:sn-glycerol-3-phosphate ABC transporter ATP-binding protein UgpC [Oenococcus kitaharae]EHN58343.1 Multiple sugar ABC transporter [Oenococcus kitaharae DSM 17330]MCV3296414.1 sn-glycerol-3-phosphate ABC transporter ATP-binding protein UgpC [Oenococcus kitaharae]OEY81488.1 sugar ABC transporter ATP-binding protein [Oenococcus kitaharae]OEY82975.1 sugar ABC transporter ATP-binding protein [Oenococcus kitaharae]OEY84480.1 sugar ABC transporter ATP-binding protein [Oenococcus kitaharae]
MVEMSLEHIRKIYPGQVVAAVPDYSLQIKDGEFTVFIGPSGSGKSTVLRMIAGLEDITSGEFKMDGKVMNDVEPKNRGIAMVFQNYALYPHMTVFDNMAFGLKLRKEPKDKIKAAVDKAADLLGLTDFLDRKPANLSGGQRQRVALGRAMVRDAKVMLLDEPLSNLDAKLRVEMRSTIAKLHQELGNNFIYVTHDQIEAMTMADRIVLIDHGVIQQDGSPEDLYNHPGNKFVAGFMGSPSMNFLNLTVSGTQLVSKDKKIQLTMPKGTAHFLKERGYEGKEIIFGIRPEDIHTEPIAKDTYPGDTVKVRLDLVEPLGAETMYYFQLDSQQFVARVGAREISQTGDEAELTFEMPNAHFFDPETELVVVPDGETVYKSPTKTESDLANTKGTKLEGQKFSKRY